MTDPNDPDLTGQEWPHPPDVLPPAPPDDGYERLRSDTLDRIADGFDLPREIVHDYAGTGWDQPTDMEQLLVRERAAQARHRARTRQLQDIQNTTLTILIPLIGLISAVLLAGIARLVWSL